MLFLNTNVLAELTRDTPERKTSLAAAVHALINNDVPGRVEPFDATAASHHAVVISERIKLGRPIGAAESLARPLTRATIHTGL